MVYTGICGLFFSVYLKMNLGFVAAALIGLAILPLPYGYYTFLRIAITGISAYLAYLRKHNKDRRFYILVAIAILFNPLIPIHFPREIWMPIDIILAIYFLIVGRRLNK